MEDTKRKRYPNEYKLQVVRLVKDEQRKPGELAKDLGLDPALIYRWIRLYEKNPDILLPGSGKSTEKEELRRLKKKYRTTTNSKHNKPVVENLLMRNFTAESPNKIWLGDITYIRTKEGFLYLAVVMDMFSRMPVGYNMQNHLRTPLVLDALRKAIEKRGKPVDLIFHSDQGIQYASEEFTQRLREYGIIFPHPKN